MERKSGLTLEGYPNYIAPYNIAKLSRRHHPLGKMPVYPTNTEPSIWYEETLASERYKNLVDEWCRVHKVDNVNKVVAPGFGIMMALGAAMQHMMSCEFGKYRELEKIAEETVREYFNISKEEILFDIEILDPTAGEKPTDGFDIKNDSDDETDINDPSFSPDFRDEIVRRRLTNALIQGASLKGHYLFHMASESLQKLMGKGVTDLYNSAMITNDLYYYYIDDVICSKAAEAEQQAGMVEIDYSGEVPVIRCKAMCFTVLMHEMIKGVTEVLFTEGLPKDPNVAKEVIDFCDTVLNEFWDIRLGPKIWEKLYELIDDDDQKYLKHIIVGLAQLNTTDFLAFLKAMFAGNVTAKNTIQKIIGTKIHQIAEYAIEKNSESDEDDDLPDIDWDSLGL